MTRAVVKAEVLSTGPMRNLSGGNGDGCNFEEDDRFSNARRWFHQATLYGFLLCGDIGWDGFALRIWD